MPQAGQLDQRIQLKRKTLSAAGGGGANVAWTTYATVWAAASSLSGQEREEAMRNDAVSRFMFRIRYRSDVLEADRIQWRGRYYNIRFIKQEGPRNSWLDIEAELGASV